MNGKLNYLEDSKFFKNICEITSSQLFNIKQRNDSDFSHFFEDGTNLKIPKPHRMSHALLPNQNISCPQDQISNLI